VTQLQGGVNGQKPAKGGYSTKANVYTYVISGNNVQEQYRYINFCISII